MSGHQLSLDVNTATTRRMQNLRKHLEEYSKHLVTLLDALSALRSVGLTSYSSKEVQRALEQVNEVLTAIDASEASDRKLARWFARLDYGTFAQLFTADGFVEALGGDLLKDMRKGETTWGRIHNTWGRLVSHEAFEAAEAEREAEGDKEE